MSSYLVWIQVAATAAIAAFAFTTWRVTRLYAKVAKLSLVEHAITHSGGGVRGPHDLYSVILKLLREDFTPKEWEMLKPYLPTAARQD